VPCLYLLLDEEEIKKKRKSAERLLKWYYRKNFTKKLPKKFPNNPFLQDMDLVKNKLEFLYNHCDERLKKVWKLRFIKGRHQEIVLNEYTSSRKYFRDKDILMDIIADAFVL
jgi:hypothetical protein